METINLTISLNGLTANTIMIRKFFNMIFISPDGLSLHVYTAVAFSSGTSKEGDSYYPSFNRNKLGLKFHYENVEKIRFKDLTESMFKQQKLLSRIWGNCNILYSEDQIRDVLCQMYSLALDPDMEIPQQALYLSDPSKSKFHNCVVCQGTYEPWDTDHYFVLSEKHNSSGLEYLNWIKSEIKLNHSLVNDKLKFTIKFDMPQNVACYCPDYMWYTCIPEEFVNDLSEAMVSINDKPSSPNLMQRLADTTALQLHEWIIDENIDRCKRYRLLFDGQSSAELTPKSFVSATISILQRRNKRSNKQFFIGLLLAFFLAYSSDWTRLNEMYSYLFESSSFSPFTYMVGILFPICIILMYLSVIMPVARVTSGLESHLRIIIKWCKILGIVAIIGGLACFFLLFPILKINNVKIPSQTQSMIIICMLSGLCFSCVYIGIGLWKRLDFYDYF